MRQPASNSHATAWHGDIPLHDVHDLNAVRRAIAQLERVRTQFVNWLRSVPADQLTKRPKPHKWSAIEHVRHLLAAEQLYIDRWITRSGHTPSPLGLPSRVGGKRRRRIPHLDHRSCRDLGPILVAWEQAHARTQAFLATATDDSLRAETCDVDLGQGTVGNVLKTLVDHDLNHMRKAEAAVAVASRNTKTESQANANR